MTNPYSNHLHDLIFGEAEYKAPSKRVKARVLPKLKELNTKPIRAMARVKKINANKYIITSFSNKENTAMIIKRLKAFNDMEIAYDDDLDTNPLIKKSKKEIWVVSKNDKGELVLERNI